MIFTSSRCFVAQHKGLCAKCSVRCASMTFTSLVPRLHSFLRSDRGFADAVRDPISKGVESGNETNTYSFVTRGLLKKIMN